jgi:predicted metalloprotease with PDZ domain
MRKVVAAGLTALLALSAGAAEPSGLTITLKPAAEDARHLVPFLDVTITLSSQNTEAGQPLLRLALVSSNVQTVADQLEDLRASDRKGPFDLTAHDDAGDAPHPSRHWTAARAVEGPLTVRYRVPVTNALNPRGAAPPLELRSEEGALSAAGSTFLLLPDSEQPYRVALKWDLGAGGAKASALSSFGPGDVTLPAPIPMEKLDDAFFMMGKIGRYPDPPRHSGFFSAWQGTPPFDAGALMRWTETLYGRYLGYFHSEGAPPPYGVFLRTNLINAGGGVELGQSFVGTYDQKTPVEEFKFTLAHEMVHTFVGHLDQPEELLYSWFSEGLAVYYQNRLPLRAGLITEDEFLTDLNITAARYYTDALNTTPNDQIPQRFWADTRVRVLPYDRGALYFAVVDSQVRKASGGKRSLDDLVLAMLDRPKHGQKMDFAAWQEILVTELGEPGRAGLQAMLGGALVLPDPDAFGPCFTRGTAPLRRYELGFAPEVLVQPKRIIHGLVAGSNAERAGLRDGDEITRPVPQDKIQADQKATLALEIKRDGKTFTVTYLPRGETVDAYQWTRTRAAGCGQ